MKLSNELLTASLSGLLGKPGIPLHIISRKRFEGSGSSPAEVVNVTVGSRKLSLFCKCLSPQERNMPDHRNGTAYEANFYKTVFKDIPPEKLTYYGEIAIPETNEWMMVLEYLGDHLRIDLSPEDEVLQKAAAWIARFHSLNLSRWHGEIRNYDRHYFIGWAQRFEALSSGIWRDHPFIPDMLDYFISHVHILLQYEQCIIHGEYYPKNILVKEGIVYPVDWESAAVSVGEIDLACLIEGWDNEVAEKAKALYFSMCGIEGKEAVRAGKRLLLAQLYLFFRWWPDKLNHLSSNAHEHLIKHLYDLKAKVFPEGVSIKY